MECRHGAQHGQGSQRHKRQAGPQPEPVSGCNAGRKEPCRMEEREGAQAGRGWTVESLHGGGRFGLHRVGEWKRFYGGQAYQERRNWTTVSRWKVWGKRSARVMDWIAYPEPSNARRSRAKVAGSQET